SEEDQIGPPQDGHGGIFGRDVDQQPVVCWRIVGGEYHVDHVERGEIDHSRLRTGKRTHLFVLLDDVAARHDHHELRGAVAGPKAGNVAQLGVFDPERRGLPDLPPDELRQIGCAFGNLFESQNRNLRYAVGDRQSDAAGPDTDALEYALQRLGDGAWIRDVRGVQRRADRTWRERLDRVCRHAEHT